MYFVEYGNFWYLRVYLEEYVNFRNGRGSIQRELDQMTLHLTQNVINRIKGGLNAKIWFIRWWWTPLSSFITSQHSHRSLSFSSSFFLPSIKDWNLVWFWRGSISSSSSSHSPSIYLKKGLRRPQEFPTKDYKFKRGFNLRDFHLKLKLSKDVLAN